MIMPFLQTFGIRGRYVEMGSLVQEWQAKQSGTPQTKPVLYTDMKAPKELVEAYYGSLDPEGLNVVVGARELVFLDVLPYLRWAGHVLGSVDADVRQILVRLMASQFARQLRSKMDHQAFVKQDKAELDFGLDIVLERAWQLVLNNEDAGDLVEAPLRVVDYIFRHVALASAGVVGS